MEWIFKPQAVRLQSTVLSLRVELLTDAPEACDLSPAGIYFQPFFISDVI